MSIRIADFVKTPTQNISQLGMVPNTFEQSYGVVTALPSNFNVTGPLLGNTPFTILLKNNCRIEINRNQYDQPHEVVYNGSTLISDNSIGYSISDLDTIFYVMGEDSTTHEFIRGFIYSLSSAPLVFNVQFFGTTQPTAAPFLESLIFLSNPEDPYGTSPESKPDGGYGDYDYSGDNIDIPSLPSWSITDSGFVTLYKPSLAQIKSLAQYLWTGIFDLSTYKKIFADPMDCIISLSRVPIDADATGSQILSVGNISTGLTFNVLSSQFVEVSFTSKNIGLRANGFLDYAPYVKVQLYLPFIGMRALSIDDIAGKPLTLKYQIDLFTGACTAYLKCKTKNSDGNEIESVLYQFTGNVLANIPITQANYSSFIQSVIGAAAKTGSALISGGAAAAGAAAMSSGINVAANIKPDIERSGNMTATGGFLGVKKPYLIVTYPNICKPINRNKTVAIPSFIGLGIQSDNSNLKLSDFKGLTILHKINVKKIPCTEVERQMIETQLTTEGVIL